MANLNKVMLIGRLTRDPESRSFSNGGKVTKLGFCVNNRRKNRDSGQWEDEPVWLDVEAFNRGENGKTADLMEQLRKGQQVFIEGHLQLDSWKDNDGNQRSKLKIVVDNFQYLEPKGEGGNGGGRPQQRQPARAAGAAPRSAAPAQGYPDAGEYEGAGGDFPEGDIPF